MKEAELIEAVRRIMAVEGTEEAIDALTDAVSAAVPHPAWTDRVYHDDRNLTAEEVVREALAYRPIAL